MLVRGALGQLHPPAPLPKKKTSCWTHALNIEQQPTLKLSPHICSAAIQLGYTFIFDILLQNTTKRIA